MPEKTSLFKHVGAFYPYESWPPSAPLCKTVLRKHRFFQMGKELGPQRFRGFSANKSSELNCPIFLPWGPKAHQLVSPDFLPPARCDFSHARKGKRPFSRVFLWKGRFPFLAWEKPHLARGRKSGLTNWCAFGPWGGEKRPEFRRKRDLYEPLQTAMAQVLLFLNITPWRKRGSETSTSLAIVWLFFDFLRFACPLGIPVRDL